MRTKKVKYDTPVPIRLNAEFKTEFEKELAKENLSMAEFFRRKAEEYMSIKRAAKSNN